MTEESTTARLANALDEMAEDASSMESVDDEATCRESAALLRSYEATNALKDAEIDRLQGEVRRSHRDTLERHAIAARAPFIPCTCKDCLR